MTHSEEETRESESKRTDRKQAPKSVEVTAKGKEPAQIVSDAIGRLTESLVTLQVKPTMAEYLKLLELAKELQFDNGGKEVQVKWIDPGETWSDEA